MARNKHGKRLPIKGGRRSGGSTTGGKSSWVSGSLERWYSVKGKKKK